MKLAVSLALVLLVVACADVQSDSSNPTFVDEAASRGLDFTYRSGATDKHRLPEITGGV